MPATTLATEFLLWVQRGVRNELLSYDTNLHTSSRHYRLSRPYFCPSFVTDDVFFAHDRTLFLLLVGGEYFNDLEVHIFYRHVYPQWS